MMMRFVICSLLLYSSVYHRGSHYESSRVEAAGRSSGECGTEPPVNPFYLFMYIYIHILHDMQVLCGDGAEDITQDAASNNNFGRVLWDSLLQNDQVK